MKTRDLFVKKLRYLAEESKLIPMWGKVPTFPWEEFAKHLSAALSIEDLHLSPIDADWIEYEDILKGLGDHPVVTSLTMSPLSPSFFFALAKEDVAKLSSLMLSQDGKWSFSDPDYQKGFFKYCFLNIVKAFDDLSVYEELSPKLNNQAMPKEKAYCVDVTIKASGNVLNGKLILPEGFHKVVVNHFANRPLSLENVDSSIEVPLSFQVGHVDTRLDELIRMQPGDFLILDHCTFHPNEKKGVFQLCLEDSPIFVAQCKNGQTNIIDYALVEHASNEEEFMIEDHPDDHEEDYDDDEDFTEDEEFDDDDEEIHDEDFEEDEEEEERSEQDENVTHVIATKEIPLSVKVEVSRIKLPLKKLLGLKPGSTLELGVTMPEQVLLTVENQVIGKGELIQLGDMIGVKISEISH